MPPSWKSAQHGLELERRLQYWGTGLPEGRFKNPYEGMIDGCWSNGRHTLRVNSFVGCFRAVHASNGRGRRNSLTRYNGLLFIIDGLHLE